MLPCSAPRFGQRAMTLSALLPIYLFAADSLLSLLRNLILPSISTKYKTKGEPLTPLKSKPMSLSVRAAPAFTRCTKRFFLDKLKCLWHCTCPKAREAGRSLPSRTNKGRLTLLPSRQPQSWKLGRDEPAQQENALTSSVNKTGFLGQSKTSESLPKCKEPVYEPEPLAYIHLQGCCSRHKRDHSGKCQQQQTP